jgi:hypothetical protein
MKTITMHEINGMRIIAVDNEAFDWGLEEDAFKAAQLAIKNNPKIKEIYIKNIQKYFLDCFSEFMGRTVTIKEINEGIKCGLI